jgi:hypothetical protein
MRERFVSSTKLPYQLAPDKTTLKLPGILLKLPYQLDKSTCTCWSPVRGAAFSGSIHALKQCAIPCLSVQL